MARFMFYYKYRLIFISILFNFIYEKLNNYIYCWVLYCLVLYCLVLYCLVLYCRVLLYSQWDVAVPSPLSSYWPNKAPKDDGKISSASRKLSSLDKFSQSAPKTLNCWIGCRMKLTLVAKSIFRLAYADYICISYKHMICVALIIMPRSFWMTSVKFFAFIFREVSLLKSRPECILASALIRRQ
jgi:hypothetical protein